jgi:hypothetical protein
MSKLEVVMHDREFFLDMVSGEGGEPVRKTLSVHRTYSAALDAKIAWYEAKLQDRPSDMLLAVCKIALTHIQLLGSGQPPPYSNAEMCTILGDAIEKEVTE